jgi:hypothetical protein
VSIHLYDIAKVRLIRFSRLLFLKLLSC